MQAPTIVEYTVDLGNDDEHEDTRTSFHDHSHPPSYPTDTSPASSLHPEAAPVPHSHRRPGPNGFLNGDIPGVPSSRVHTRSASMATIPSLTPAAAGSTIPHSQTVPSLAQRVTNHRKHNRRAPSLQLQDDHHTRLGIEGAVPHSPMTPSYRFGVDEHFASQQHTHLHTPNLHDHSHVHAHGHSREGHSHNMRGLFLHVMAVSSFSSPLYIFAFVWLTEVALVRPLIGHAGLGWCDRVDATHTILWLDGLRPNSVDFHRGSHRSERDPARH